MDIVWDAPKALLGLWILVPLALLWSYAIRRRSGAADRFADPKMGRRLIPPRERGRAWLRGALMLAAFATIVVALARPRWGVYFEQLSQRGTDVVIALDVSRSMLSQDVTPNRLERAKSDVRDFLRKVVGDRVGLVAFAGKPSLACPLTSDHGFFRMVLDSLGPDSAPRGGTAIGDAIRASLDAMEEDQTRDQAIVLITDGEDHDSFPLEAAAAAAERGVKIFSVGLGDPDEGSRIPAADDGGGRGYVKHEGQEVWSKMDERLLMELAVKTDGTYVPARTSVYDLGEIYEQHFTSMRTSEIRSDKRKRYRERFQLFLGLGFLLLLAEMLVRPFSHKAAMARAAGVLILLSGAEARAFGSEDAVAKVGQGARLLEEGKFEQASVLFDEADVSLPDNPIITFDRALARQLSGDSDEADSLYLKAAATRNSGLSADARYNMGLVSVDRARLEFGEHPEEAAAEVRDKGLAHVAAAVGHLRACLDVDPDHEDARYNLELLRMWVKHVESAWAEKDRQQKRDEMELVQFLEMLLDAEESLALTLQRLLDEEDTPIRRLALDKIREAQGRLAEEIDPLKEKIEQAFSAEPQGPPGAPPPQLTDEQREQMDQARTALLEAATSAGEAMMSAAADLEGGLWSEAAGFQEQSIAALERMWLPLVPFPQALNTSIRNQEGVIAATKPHTTPEPVPEPEDPGVDPTAATDPQDAAALTPLQPDPDKIRTLLRFHRRHQERVGKVAALLPMKADQFVQQMGAAMPPPGAQDPAGPPATPPDPHSPDGEQPDLQQQLEQLKSAQAKAEEHAPTIARLSEEISAHLDAPDASAALPKEEEVLRLLQEIAEDLPKQEQEQQGDGEQQPQDQDQQQEQQEQQDPQNDESEQEPQEPDEKGQEPQEQEGQEQPAQDRPMTPEEAQALLRRAAERERDHKEERRKLLRGAARPGKVERDW